jgi:4-carboxymuconolactone decarboxylase
MMAFQRMTTEMCRGTVWTRPGLDWRTRSQMTNAMLTALHAMAKSKLHVRGALEDGLSVEASKMAHATLTKLGALPAKVE